MALPLAEMFDTRLEKKRVRVDAYTQVRNGKLVRVRSYDRDLIHQLVDALKPGQTLEFPDGQKITKEKEMDPVAVNRHQITWTGPDGTKQRLMGPVAYIVRERSARSEHPKSLGGEEKFRSLDLYERHEIHQRMKPKLDAERAKVRARVEENEKKRTEEYRDDQPRDPHSGRWTRMYHSTDQSNVRGIMEQGLVPDPDGLYGSEGEPKGVYLSSEPDGWPGQVLLEVDVKGLNVKDDPLAEGSPWYYVSDRISPERIRVAEPMNKYRDNQLRDAFGQWTRELGIGSKPSRLSSKRSRSTLKRRYPRAEGYISAAKREARSTSYLADALTEEFAHAVRFGLAARIGRAKVDVALKNLRRGVRREPKRAWWADLDSDELWVRAFDSWQTLRDRRQRGTGAVSKFGYWLDVAWNGEAAMAKSADTKGVMVAIPVDGKTAKKLALGNEPADNLHVTLAYLGKTKDVDEARLREVVAGWATTVPSLRVRTTGLGRFEPGSKSNTGEENPEVTYAPVDASRLGEHRARLVDMLERAGVSVASDYDFTPHMTIHYGDGAPESLPKLEFDAPAVVVAYGGEWTEVPLTGVPSETVAKAITEEMEKAVSDVEGYTQTRNGKQVKVGGYKRNFVGQLIDTLKEAGEFMLPDGRKVELKGGKVTVDGTGPDEAAMIADYEDKMRDARHERGRRWREQQEKEDREREPSEHYQRPSARERREDEKSDHDAAVEQVAAQAHDKWREERKRDDGSYEPREKDTTDKKWAKEKGAEKVDIANTDYKDLPEDWQAENKQGAESAVRAVKEHGGDVEAASEAVHDDWVNRHKDEEWAKEAGLLEPYDKLTEEEKEKDREFVRAALEALGVKPEFKEEMEVGEYEERVRDALARGTRERREREMKKRRDPVEDIDTVLKAHTPPGRSRTKWTRGKGRGRNRQVGRDADARERGLNTRRTAMNVLRVLGYQSGSAQERLVAFQEKHGLPATGKPDRQTLLEMRAEIARLRSRRAERRARGERVRAKPDKMWDGGRRKREKRQARKKEKKMEKVRERHPDDKYKLIVEGKELYDDLSAEEAGVLADRAKEHLTEHGSFRRSTGPKVDVLLSKRGGHDGWKDQPRDPHTGQWVDMFTHGILMRPTTMKSYAPKSQLIGEATLKNHERTHVRGPSDIVPKEGAYVPGVVWRVHESDLPALDQLEGVEFGMYTREKENVVLDDGTELEADVYYMPAGRKQHLDDLAEKVADEDIGMGPVTEEDLWPGGRP